MRALAVWRVVELFALTLTLIQLGQAERPKISVGHLGLADKYAVVRPAVTHYLAPGDHHTRLNDKQHREQLTFTLLAYEEQLEILLYRSDDLMSGRYTHVWRDPNGTLFQSRRQDVDHCFYHGKVAGEPQSIVTAHTCGEGIEASVRRANGEHLMLMPGSLVEEMNLATAKRQLQNPAAKHLNEQLPPHVIFRSSDQRLPGCPISHLEKVAAPVGYLDSSSFEHYSAGFTPMVLQRDGDTHRGLQTALVPLGGCTCLDSWAYTVGGVLHEYRNGGCHNPDSDPGGPWCFTQAQCGLGTSDSYQYCEEVNEASSPSPPPPPSAAGCRYHVEVLMANDHTMLDRVNGDIEEAHAHALRVANAVKEIYQEMSELQICITLVALHSFATVSEEGELYTSPDATIETFLNNWSDWYAQNAVENYEGADLSSDNGVLLTTVDRSGDTTGLGWVGTMCNSRTSSSVVEENHYGIWQYTAETMAHEMGHNFGSGHDGVGEAANCDDSEFIMAASGCGNCGFNQFKAWSSCSATYIQDKLQALTNTPSNCLLNNPRAPVCAPGEESCSVCGDFIVSGDEACDTGPAGSALCNGADSAAPCQLATGVVCAEGECCDASTGQYKSPGNLCREAMHQCDLPDYCSGTSATCGSDLFKADGTECTESGPGSKCYVGSCVGLDGQCGNAFQGYTGTWVASARNGIDASCTQPSGGCGELQCTNTDWDGYCQAYNCPAGYQCNVDDVVISGPSTHSFCSCDAKADLVNDPMQRVMIADGTPCGPAGEDNICLSSVCTPRPVPVIGAPVDSDVDCIGSWYACDASCQKLFFISTPQSGNGSPCEANAGATAACAPGVGSCPDDVDCQGSWSTCSASCTQVFSISEQASGSGNACESADAATRICAAGTGDCPAPVYVPVDSDVDCIGSWYACDASCQKLFIISTPQSGNGSPCEANAGATAACAPGVGSCPDDVDCQGSWSTCSASCTQVFSISEQASGSGNACESADAATRVCAAGTGDCAALSCTDASSCSNRGTCARDVQGSLACACDPGWTGSTCSEQITCPHDCTTLLRHACISSESCGACFPGHSHVQDQLLPGEACDLLPLSTVDPLSALVSINANIKAGTSHADVVMDGNIYSHWIAEYDDSMQIDQKPRVVMSYSASVALSHYSIMSANAHPSEDPESWYLECYSTVRGEWEQVDYREGEIFDMRHQQRVYPIGGGDGTLVSCTQVALRIVGIRDAETQGGGTIQAEMTPIESVGSEGGPVESGIDTTITITQEYSADVQIAEVQFFRRISSDQLDSLPTTAVSAEIALDADFDSIGSDPDSEAYTQFVSGFKTDVASLLGVNEEQIIVNSVLPGSMLVDFTVSPAEDGRSVSVTALSTTFSTPGISLAGATTTSTITSASVTVEPVSVASFLPGGGDAGSLRASGADPQEGETSIATRVFFLVLFIVVVLGCAYGCHRMVVSSEEDVPKSRGVKTGVDYDPEEGLPPSLPSAARLELGRCLHAQAGNLDAAHVHEQFDQLDIDHDGSLTKDEVERFVTGTLGYAPTADFLSGVFAAFDQDCDGTLSEVEFAQMLKTLRKTLQDNEEREAKATAAP